VRGFLRSYADFLGLDGPRLVDEYRKRVPDPQPALDLGPPVSTRPLVSRGLVTLGVVAACVGLLGLLAWRLGSEPRQSAGPVAAPPQAHRLAARTVPERRERLVRARSQPVPAPRLALLAARGDCWLSVRVGGRSGFVLWEGMLYQGRALRFSRRSLWVRIGAPWNLEARLNGKPLRTLPANTGDILVTGAGATPSAT
jgi:hypothetical protein